MMRKVISITKAFIRPPVLLIVFLLIILNISFVSAVSPSELVWFKGENAFDSSSTQRYNLTFQAGATTATGKIGNGIKFIKASSQYANTSSTNTIIASGKRDFTITKWFNFTIDCVAGNNCFWEGMGVASAGNGTTIGPISAPPTWFRMNSGGANNDSMGFDWTKFVGRNTFMVYYYNSSNDNVDIYIGNSTGNMTYYPKMGKLTGGMTFTSGNQRIILGADLAIANFADVIFDDWRLFNASLSRAEIDAIYNNNLGTTSSLNNLTNPPAGANTVTINTPTNNSAFFVSNHNYFDVNVSSSGFGGNVTTQLNIYNSSNDLLYTYFSQSNPFLQNITNLPIGTYKINATAWNYSNYDFTNNIYVNQTGSFNGVRQGGQTGSNFNGINFTITSNKEIYLNQNYTILYSFKTSNDITSKQTIACQRYSSTRCNYGLYIETGNIRSSFQNTTLGYSNGNPAVSVQQNTIYNIVQVHNDSGMFIFSEGIFNNSYVTLGGTNNMENKNLTIGDWIGLNFFNGSIYKIIIWNRSLSDFDVLSENSFGPDTPTNNTNGLVLQYLLNNTASVYSNSTHVFNVNLTSARVGGFENTSTTNTAYIYNSTVGSILTPVSGYNSSTRFLNISWSNATFNPVFVNVTNTTLTLLNDDLTTNRTIYNFTSSQSLNNYSYDLYVQNLSVGMYYIRLDQVDINGNGRTTSNRFNLTTNAQVNITAKRINNNISITTYTTVITDESSSLVQTNYTTTGVALFDVVKERNYTVVITSTNYTTSNANMTINETFNNRLFYLTRFNSILINFYDEDTLNLIVNQTIYLDLISSIYSNNYTTTNGTLLAELLSPTTYQSRYSSENYTERFYSFTIVNDTAQTLSLYLKKNTTSILLQVKDVALNPVEGAVVKAQKQVPSLGGIFLTVEICTTDFNGECILSLTQNDEYYRFIVLVDGNVQLTTTASYIIDDVITLVLPGQGTNADDSFEYLNIEADVSWTNSTKTFSFDFSDPNNLQSSYCLDIYRNDVLINRTCLLSDLGSIDVTLLFSNNTNGTFKANGLIRINDNYLLLDQDIEYFPVAGTVANTGKLGLLIQLMLSLVFIIAVKNNPEFIPIAFGLSLIFGKAGSFTLLSWTTVSATAFACLVISVWLGKNKND